MEEAMYELCFWGSLKLVCKCECYFRGCEEDATGKFIDHHKFCWKTRTFIRRVVEAEWIFYIVHIEYSVGRAPDGNGANAHTTQSYRMCVVVVYCNASQNCPASCEHIKRFGNECDTPTEYDDVRRCLLSINYTRGLFSLLYYIPMRQPGPMNGCWRYNEWR